MLWINPQHLDLPRCCRLIHNIRCCRFAVDFSWICCTANPQQIHSKSCQWRSTICTHPTGDLINAGGDTFFQLVKINSVTQAVNLGVVSIKMGAQIVLDDYVGQPSREGTELGQVLTLEVRCLSERKWGICQLWARRPLELSSVKS